MSRGGGHILISPSYQIQIFFHRPVFSLSRTLGHYVPRSLTCADYFIAISSFDISSFDVDNPGSISGKNIDAAVAPRTPASFFGTHSILSSSPGEWIAAKHA
jgi:hypothetical protein